MTTKEMIEVMQAFEDGETIQHSYKGEDDWETILGEPLWNWYECDYRIKPEPKYVPYDNVSEVEKDKWIKSKKNGVLYRIEGVDANDDSIHIWCEWICLDTLFQEYTYEDGTPCGKLVEE